MKIIITLEQLQAILAQACNQAGIAPRAQALLSQEEAYAAIAAINNQDVFDQLLALLQELEKGEVIIGGQPIRVQEKGELSANEVELEKVKGLVEDVVSQNQTATATAGGGSSDVLVEGSHDEKHKATGGVSPMTATRSVEELGDSLDVLVKDSKTANRKATGGVSSKIATRSVGSLRGYFRPTTATAGGVSSMTATSSFGNSRGALDGLVEEDSKTANRRATAGGVSSTIATRSGVQDSSTARRPGRNRLSDNPMYASDIGFTKEAISAQNATNYKVKIEFINELRGELSDPKRDEWFRISNYSTYREYDNISQKLLEGAKAFGTNPSLTQNTVELYAEDKYRGGFFTVKDTKTKPVKVILSREDNHIMATYKDNESVAIAEIKKDINGSLVIQDIKPDNVLNLGWNGLLAKLFVNEDSSTVSNAFTALVLLMASPLIAVAAILVALNFLADKTGLTAFLTNNVLAPTWNFLKDSVFPWVKTGSLGLIIFIGACVALGLYIAAVVYNKIVAPLLAHILINVYDIASQISLLVYNFVTNPVFLGISTSVALAVTAVLVLASNPIVLAVAAVIFMSVMIFVGLDSKLGARQNRTNEKLDYAIQLLHKTLGHNNVDISAEEKWTTAAENAKNTSGKMLENIKNIFNSIFKLLGLTSLYNVLFNKQEHTQNRALNPTGSTFKNLEKRLNPLGHMDYGRGLNSWFADGSYDMLNDDGTDSSTSYDESTASPLHEADHDSSSTQAAAGKSWLGGLFGRDNAANDDASSDYFTTLNI